MMAAAARIQRQANRGRRVAMAAVAAGSVAIAVLTGIGAGHLLRPNEQAPTAGRVVRAGQAKVTTLTRAPSATSARLAVVLRRLDRARLDSRAALKRARTSTGQTAAARRLALAHLRAAASVRAAAGGAASSLGERLAMAARAYAALGRAASDGSVERFGAARRDVNAADAGLASAVDRTRRRGRPRVSAADGSRAEPPATTVSSTTSLVFALILFGIAFTSGVMLGFRPTRIGARTGAHARQMPARHPWA
jgi:hypothetical protein